MADSIFDELMKSFNEHTIDDFKPGDKVRVPMWHGDAVYTVVKCNPWGTIELRNNMGMGCSHYPKDMEKAPSAGKVKLRTSDTVSEPDTLDEDIDRLKGSISSLMGELKELMDKHNILTEATSLIDYLQDLVDDDDDWSEDMEGKIDIYDGNNSDEFVVSRAELKYLYSIGFLDGQDDELDDAVYVKATPYVRP